jgi:hypothetical protein
LSAFRKSVIAVRKLRIFDIPLSANGIGSEGYRKPEAAHAAKTKNIPSRENRVYFDRFVKGDKVRSENVEMPTRNRGRKKSTQNSVGAGGTGGYVLPMTIMSNESSNIIGAAAVPTKAPPSAIFSPRLQATYAMMMNVATPDMSVIGLIGFVGTA